MIAHILERFVIHFFAASGLFLLAWFAYHWTNRRWPRLWSFVAPAVFVFSIAVLREAFDVAHGQPLLKAWTDYVSWALGLAASAYGLYRADRWIR